MAGEPVSLPNSGLLSLQAEPGVRPIHVIDGLLELGESEGWRVRQIECLGAELKAVPLAE